MSSRTLPTIKNVSAPRLRDPLAQKHSSIPVPTHQRKEKLAARQERQRQIDDAVSEWYSYTLAKADELGKLFNKKPRYFLDMFFQGGVKMVNHRHKTNAYNAFKSLKAAELSQGFFFCSIIVACHILTCRCLRRESDKTTDSPGGLP
jgi:hypothetical protein